MLRKLFVLSCLLLIMTVSFAARGASETPMETPETPVEFMSDGSGGSGGDIPDDPSSAMEEAVNIYIHVVLRQPDGPPAPSNIYILSADCSGPSVVLKSDQNPTVLGGQYFYVWRRPMWPFYYGSDLDRDSSLVGSTGSIYYTDFFDDPHWSRYGSYGICDTAVNYFYVFTTVDSNVTTAEIVTSPTPSVCVGEFDQALSWGPAGTRNYISYPLDHDYEFGREIGNDIPGAGYFYHWNVETQSWLLRSRKLGATWMSLGSEENDRVTLGGVYAVAIDNTEPYRTFSTYAPGYVPEDVPHTFQLPSGYSAPSVDWFMLPFYETYTISTMDGVSTPLLLVDVARQIDPTASHISELRVWDSRTQTMLLGARYVAAMHRWIGTKQAVPGRPVCAIVNNSEALVWPPAI